jgi:hypothetical protein
MQDSGEGPVEAIQLVKNRGAANVSARKIAANRQNARKSTGPKTLMGKAFSRRKALKHGLFARHFMDFAVHAEDPQKYQELLNGLRDDYRPIGRAEELEVERIALCWWKLQRVWRHENAVNRVALRDKGSRELGERTRNFQTREEQEKAVILLLQSATKEIEVTGEISHDLKQRMFATMPGLEALWPHIEEGGREALNLSGLEKIARNSSPKELTSALAQCTATIGVKMLERRAETRRASIMEIAIAQHVIPNSDDLDRILRYDTAIDRSLSRALDRLERLQMRRRDAVLESLKLTM